MSFRQTFIFHLQVEVIIFKIFFLLNKYFLFQTKPVRDFLLLNRKVKIKMKSLFVSFTVVVISLLFITSAYSQKVCVSSSSGSADVKVYEVNSESSADLLVYKVSSSGSAGNNDGNWYISKSSSDCDKKIYFVDYESGADLKIYFVSSSSLAGWKNKSKKHLMQ